jgi:hypothetical protein
LRGARALDAAFFGEDLVIRVVGDTLVLAPALVVSEALIAAIVGKVAHFFAGAALRLLALALPLLAAIKIPTCCQIAVALQGPVAA